MNKIEKLIKELCPNGVEWKKLGEVCECITGGDSPKDCVKGQKFPTKDYPYPVYANGDETYGYAKSFRIDKYAVTISSIGNVGTAYYREPNFTPIIRLKTFIPKGHNLNVKFLYYCLSAMSFVGTNSSLSSMKAADFHKIPIPLPPLPIQTEIVRILDKFVEHQEQLERLIELRKKQYEYYREEMLKPKEGEVWETKRLGEIAEVTKLAGFEFTEYVEYSDEGKIIALRGLNVKDGKLVLDDVKYIDNSNFSKLNRSKLLKNDLLYTYVGTVGQSAIIEDDDKYYLAPNVAMIRVKSQDVLISKYLLFYLLSSKFKNSELEKLTASSSMKNITMEKIRKFNIVFPSVSKQKDIINTLVNFESSIAALTSALELSKKRYEYYRDKMMRF